MALNLIHEDDVVSKRPVRFRLDPDKDEPGIQIYCEESQRWINTVWINNDGSVGLGYFGSTHERATAKRAGLELEGNGNIRVNG